MNFCLHVYAHVQYVHVFDIGVLLIDPSEFQDRLATCCVYMFFLFVLDGSPHWKLLMVDSIKKEDENNNEVVCSLATTESNILYTTFKNSKKPSQ